MFGDLIDQVSPSVWERPVTVQLRCIGLQNARSRSEQVLDRRSQKGSSFKGGKSKSEGKRGKTGSKGKAEQPHWQKGHGKGKQSLKGKQHGSSGDQGSKGQTRWVRRESA